MALGLSHFFHANEHGPAAEPSSAELAAKLLPNLDKVAKIEANRDVEVLEAHVEIEGGAKVTGTAKNNTDRLIPTTEIILNLTDQNSSLLGAVSVHVDNLAPHATAAFQVPIEETNAAFALVREIQTR
jgi:hypothetical protein